MQRDAKGPDSGDAGGRTRPLPAWMPWLVWGLGAAFFLYGFFERLAPSVMHDHLMREFALTGATAGNLSAFYFYTYASLQIPVGLMVDRFGPRRLLVFGALICAGATLWFAWATGSATLSTSSLSSKVRNRGSRDPAFLRHPTRKS